MYTLTSDVVRKMLENKGLFTTWNLNMLQVDGFNSSDEDLFRQFNMEYKYLIKNGFITDDNYSFDVFMKQFKELFYKILKQNASYKMTVPIYVFLTHNQVLLLTNLDLNSIENGDEISLNQQIKLPPFVYGTRDYKAAKYILSGAASGSKAYMRDVLGEGFYSNFRDSELMLDEEGLDVNQEGLLLKIVDSPYFVNSVNSISVKDYQEYILYNLKCKKIVYNKTKVFNGVKIIEADLYLA